MKYYSTQRPVVPGGFPKPVGNKITNICNFDCREYQPSIDRRAWGYIEYKQPLSPELAEEYELVPEGSQPRRDGSLSREEYYRLLHERHEKTDWKNREQVEAFNAYAHQLRSQLEWEEES